jgi:hypothetical protein
VIDENLAGEIKLMPAQDCVDGMEINPFLDKGLRLAIYFNTLIGSCGGHALRKKYLTLCVN